MLNSIKRSIGLFHKILKEFENCIDIPFDIDIRYKKTLSGREIPSAIWKFIVIIMLYLEKVARLAQGTIVVFFPVAF